MSEVIVAALYRFATLPDVARHAEALRQCCEQAGVRGTLLLADEGINGTIAGSRAGIDAVGEYLRSVPALAGMEYKESTSAQMPFARLKVKVKREIVTMGVEGLDPARGAGTYVEPEQWNQLISDPDTLVIDTRNDYEVGIGSFRGAVAPGTAHFREFPDYVTRELRGQEQRPIAMFCTGGIRCEKGTAYLRQQGFEHVHHLKGGVLRYLETVPAEESLWDGECYVFDERVAVSHGLAQGQTVQCEACGAPVSAEQQASEAFVAEISCPACVDQLDEQRRASLEMRRAQRQGS